MTVQHPKRVLALVGPTGTGKSDLALALAERLSGEIVSCDSVQVYRKFDIGSAKPSAAERARVPHHLVDVVDWSDVFDAAVFCDMARAAIDAIRSRGRLPILCGGTGLYMRALRYGLVATPPVDPALRAQLAEAERAQPGALHARLTALDPASAQAIPPGNIHRVLRAVELCIQTRHPASALRIDHGFKTEQVPMMVCVLDRPTELLRKRITRRAQVMLDAGWVAEVQHLLAAGVSPGCRPMHAVGYREVLAHVQGDIAADALHAKIAASTWQYARRQRTWWRRERDVATFDMDQNSELVSRLIAVWEGAANKS